MAENSSTVSIVAILAILLLVGAGLYFMMTRQSGEAAPPLDIDVDVEEFPMDDRGEHPGEFVFVVPTSAAA
jgi:hypothetical protein